VLLQPLWVPAAAVLPLVILLFPDGEVTSRRWRVTLWVYAGLCVCAAAVIWVPTITAVARHDVHLDSFGDVTATDHARGPFAAVEVLAVVLILALWVSFVAHQALSWRRAAGERRQQQKWLASSAVVTVVAFVLGAAFSGTPVGDLAGIGIAALPLGIGVGILKYRLYDIDRIISRTLAYAIVTGLLIGLYAGLVLLATRILSLHTPVAVAAATLAAAALFNPLRQRVQRAVDRRFNRARYDAEQTVMAFAARLKDAVDLDSVRDDLAQVVSRTLEPAHLSVWVSHRDSNGPGASFENRHNAISN
jgi:histidine kinase-like protein